ncbi:MAG: hypothetical protein GC191_05575 [Azospirillum sp.]|nr:hypothetical protein [Azospirillum sp.]
MLERFGPQTIPVELAPAGAGRVRLDVRIIAVDPLDPTLWPFPDPALTADDGGPVSQLTEDLPPAAAGGGGRGAAGLEAWIAAHTAPGQSVPGQSAVIELPAPPPPAGGRVVLDLKRQFERLAGPAAPGSYLVGVRVLDRTPVRAWRRVQVTDLALTTVQDRDQVLYAVTSLATAAPIDHARLRLEARGGDGRWTTLSELETDRDGLAGGSLVGRGAGPRRLIVAKGDDVLVLDAERPPAAYAGAAGQSERWLAAFDAPPEAGPGRPLCHLFADLQDYPTADPVHLKGWLRRQSNGELAIAQGEAEFEVIGPGERQWWRRLAIDRDGGVTWQFEEGAEPGAYRVLLHAEGAVCAETRFTKSDDPPAAGPPPPGVSPPGVSPPGVSPAGVSRAGEAAAAARSVAEGGGDRGPGSGAAPLTPAFQAVAERPGYVPGDVAQLVLHSPVPTARVLAIAEQPDGRIPARWLDLANGSGRFALDLTKAQAPYSPVHFILMRGRVGGVMKGWFGSADPRRPTALATSAWVDVPPVEQAIAVGLEFPAQARPGSEITVTVRLADRLGRPLEGVVTLWLADRALAARDRQPLDPLPDFVVERPSRVVVRDTRNPSPGAMPAPVRRLAGGAPQPVAPTPSTVSTALGPVLAVPFYRPDLAVDASGIATVRISLPETLGELQLRAAAVSGPDRFGAAAGILALRQPVVVEPVLPRFIRPGDSFTIGAAARVVEGDGGPGRATVAVSGLELYGSATSVFAWDPGQSQTLGFPVMVPEPGGVVKSAAPLAIVTVTAERLADGGRDSFSAVLPVRFGTPSVAEGRNASVDRQLLRSPANGGAGARFALGQIDRIDLAVGDLVVDRVAIALPEPCRQVEITVPLAAGLEALPAEAGATPPGAAEIQRHSDRITFRYDLLPRGRHAVAVSARARIAGRFTLPPATVACQAEELVTGSGEPATVVIAEHASVP